MNNFNGRFTFFEVGFHGDQYLISIVDYLIKNCDYFIETGTNVGSTLAFVAKNHPNVQCISCEPDTDAFQKALENTFGLMNVQLFNETSENFINRLVKMDLFDQKVLFWLDAHGYGFEWPLKQEIEFISKNFKKSLVLVDDFKVPNLECFGYDVYKEYECSYEYIENSILSHDFQLYYPNYSDRTSSFHPLRGWGLFDFSKTFDLIKAPDSIKNMIRKA